MAIPVGTVAWVAVLIGSDVGSGVGFALGAGALAVVNLVVGVLVFQAIWLLVLALRSIAIRLNATRSG